ncbi:target of rapamycin complex subunit LST8 isoform X1 [Ammospiza nelsoni]|uniref:target of rapamycin complex subunit LST8 isoform X1 n=1 Tax=Ammospiza nelsoni TaxID=2857394 RepID=UPI002869CE22|nr:target of rapamycin complex subunit LST8 isoform X1 [Ammospiza nelsoni]
MNATQGTVGSDPVILATAGYDHTVRFWQAHSGICTRTVQHQDSVSFLPCRPPPPPPGPARARRCCVPTLTAPAAGERPGDHTGPEHDRSRRVPAHPHVRPELQQPQPRDQLRRREQEHHLGGVPRGRALDVHGRGGLHGPHLGPQVPEPAVPAHFPGECSHQLCLPAPQPEPCALQAELIVGDQSGAIHIWDLKTDHNEQLIPEPEVSVNSVHIDPDASYMAAVNSSGSCYVWNLTGGIGEEVTQLIPKTKIPAHNRYALQCKFSPDSTLLATCSADQTCKIWRTSNFSLMTELSIKSNNPGETSRGWMWDCAFSGDSQYIVTASSDNLARLWCVETGEIKREYSGHQKAVVCLAFNDSVLG